KLIEALLDISRIQSGQLNITRNTMDLYVLTRRVVENMQPALEQHTITMSSSGEALMIEGDELRLEQVLQNLIQNAVKYSPSGGAITVQVEHRDNMASVVI